MAPVLTLCPPAANIGRPVLDMVAGTRRGCKYTDEAAIILPLELCWDIELVTLDRSYRMMRPYVVQ